MRENPCPGIILETLTQKYLVDVKAHLELERCYFAHGSTTIVCRSADEKCGEMITIRYKPNA